MAKLLGALNHTNGLESTTARGLCPDTVDSPALNSVQTEFLDSMVDSVWTESAVSVGGMKMDPILILLRIVHVLGGVFWAGAILFVVHFLEPAVRDAGPDGATVMQALRKRRYLEAVPVTAFLTLLSGYGLYWRTFGRLHPGLDASGPELAFGLGGLASLLAFVVGVTLLRPSALRIGALGAELARVPAERKAALQEEVGRLRLRMRKSGRWVAVLLSVAILSMAVGRYL